MNMLTISFDANHHAMVKARNTLDLMITLYQKDDPAFQAFEQSQQLDATIADGKLGMPANTENKLQAAITSGLLLDSNGLPYDQRIHSSGKTFYKNGDNEGTWKYKKNVDKNLVASVEAELQQLMAIPATTEVSNPPPPPIPATTDASNPPPPPIPATTEASNPPPPPPVEQLFLYNSVEWTEKQLLDSGWTPAAIEALEKKN